MVEIFPSEASDLWMPMYSNGAGFWTVGAAETIVARMATERMGRENMVVE